MIITFYSDDILKDSGGKWLILNGIFRHPIVFLKVFNTLPVESNWQIFVNYFSFIIGNDEVF